MKRIETSKLILVVLTITVYLLMTIGTLLAWVKFDSTVLKIVATGVMSGFSVALGFYYWKAKQENVIKLKATYKDDFIAVDCDIDKSSYSDSVEGGDFYDGV